MHVVRSYWLPQQPSRLLRYVAWAVLLPLFALVPSRADAQVLIALLLGDKVSNDTFQLGINLSFAAVGLTAVESKFRLGFSVSMYGEIRLTERLHLQPELAMKLPGGAREMNSSVPGYPFTPIGEPAYDESVTNGEVSREQRYIAIPVYTKLMLGSVGLGLGPQLGILLGSNDTATSTRDGKKVNLEASTEDALNPVDFGISASVEYAFWPKQKMRSLRIRAKGYFGLMDTIKDNPGTPVRNWSFLLGGEIPIGGAPDKPKDKVQAPEEPEAAEPPA